MMLEQGDKAKLRTLMRQRRSGLSKAQQTQHALAAARHLNESRLLAPRIKNIAVYLEFDGELSTRPLIKTLRAAGKQLYVPVVDATEAHMHFTPLTYPHQTNINRLGINEPHHQRPALTLDAMIVPLTAFDLCGRRLGMGGGFYDRYLNATKLVSNGSSSSKHKRVLKSCRREPLLIGFGHECQNLPADALKLQAWDVRMDWLLSERGLYQSMHRRS